MAGVVSSIATGTAPRPLSHRERVGVRGMTSQDGARHRRAFSAALFSRNGLSARAAIAAAFNWRYAFNAHAPVLPGLAKTEGFVL